MKLKKKGQMQMMETMGVLFIFFILILFSLVFYFKYQEISFNEKQEELIAKRAMDTTLKILFLPELQCSAGEAEAVDNCIDLMKLRALEGSMDQYLNDYYFNIFSYSNIYVQMIYPGKKRWAIYDNPKVKINDLGEEIKDRTNVEPTYFIVTIMDEVHGNPDSEDFKKSQGVYSLGYLAVEVYS
jgi:hypothetical protein